MRLAQVFVSADRLDDARRVLDEESVDHVVLDDARAGTGGALVVFPLPNGAVEHVLDRLREIDVVDEETEGFEVFTNATMASTPSYEELVKRHETEPAHSGIAFEELHGRVQESSWSAVTYYAATVLSVVVATAGLLVDSPALVIGAMVIAPQVSTALSASVGLVSANWETFRKGAVRQLAGLGLAVVAAGVFAWTVRTLGVVPPVTRVTYLELFGLRLSPSPLTTVAALAAGGAGAFGFTTEQSVSLVGVMIAAALVPAAAAAGVGAAWGLPPVAAGALALLAVNILAINLASTVTLGALGYRAEDASLGSLLPDDRRGVAAVVLGVLLLASAAAGAVAVHQATFDREVEQSVQRAIDSPEYRSLALVATSVTYAGPGSGSPTVTVTVERPADRDYPRLASTLDRRIDAATGENVTVRVRYIEGTTAR